MAHRSLLMYLLAASLPMFAGAGAWPRAAGETYSKVSVSRFESDETYNSGRRKTAGPDFRDRSLNLYSEYGFTDAWTGIVSLGVKSLRIEAAGVSSRESGAADAWLFLKRGLAMDPVVLSVQAGAKIPMGYDERRVPPLGQGQVDLEARVLAGRSFHPFPGYGSAEIGYRKRNGDYSDEIPYRIELGVNAGKRWLVKLSLDGTDTRANDAASTGPKGPASNVFDQDSMKLSPGLVFFLKKGFSVDVYYERVINGANTAAGESVGLGLAWQGPVRRTSR